MVVLLVCIEEFSPMDEFCPVSGQGSQTSKGNLTRVANREKFPSLPKPEFWNWFYICSQAKWEDHLWEEHIFQTL